MTALYLKEVHKFILEKLIMGWERESIAKKLNIKLSTLNSYIRDMNYNNDCTLIQLVWMYAQLGDKYIIENI